MSHSTRGALALDRSFVHSLAIDEIVIHELNGLFSLNDLHKASGGTPKHRPGYFLDSDQTKALIAEIETAGIPAVKTKEGRGGGTYACRELIIAYAAWISPVFHLKVIRVFLATSVPTPSQATGPGRWLLTIGDSGSARVETVPPDAIVATPLLACELLARNHMFMAECDLEAMLGMVREVSHALVPLTALIDTLKQLDALNASGEGGSDVTH